MVRLMVGPGDLKGIFQHDSLILLCEYENVKLLKQMSLVKGKQTNKIDNFFPWQSYNYSFSLSFLAAEKKSISTEPPWSAHWFSTSPSQRESEHSVCMKLYQTCTLEVQRGVCGLENSGGDTREPMCHVLKVLWAAQSWFGRARAGRAFFRLT